MYNSSYSQAKMGLAAKNLRKSKERSCGYYMRIVLFFSSLIQSLIIVSLVLFLVYGEPQQTVEEKRIQELEQGYARLSLENVALKAKEKNLTLQLNLTLTTKKYCENNLTTLRKLANFSSLTINSLRIKLVECERWKPSVTPFSRMACPLSTTDRYLEHRLQQAEELQKLLRANFTEQMLVIKHELENAQNDRIRYHLEAIELKRDKTYLEERIEMYEKKCKEDFIKSLQGIPEVTKEFLRRVDDLFSKHISFQLTCEKQTLQLENIRANCSSLSTEVENKLQLYLDKVGSQITLTVGANAKCMTENKRLNEDTRWCIRNRSEIIEGNKKVLKQSQQNHDKEVEGYLIDISKLKANKILLENTLSVKNIEITMLSEKVKDLNATLAVCKIMPFAGGASYGTGMSSPGMSSPGLGSNSGPGTSILSRTSGSSVGSSGTGLGSTGFGYSRQGPVWSGVGSTGPAGVPSFGSTGPGTSGLSRAGSSSPAFGGMGSSGVGSSGVGSSGVGSNGVGSSGIGSGRTGFGSTGSVGTGFGSAGSSGTSLSKPGTGGTGLGAFGSNTAGAFPFGGGHMTAQINQHLKELHQYAATD